MTVAIAGLIGVITPAILWFNDAGQSSGAIQKPEAVLVRPVQISGDEEWRSREQALTASIAGNLDRIPGLVFASQTAASSVADAGLSPRQIGERLDVDYIVEADILATEERLSAQLRLVDTVSERPVWSSEVTGHRNFAEEFEPLILNRLSGILLTLDRLADGDIEIPADLDPRARKAYLDGLAAMSRISADNYPHIVRQMQLAASIEPDFAPAHAGIAYALADGTNNYFSLEPDAYAALQANAMKRAFDLDPDSFMAQLAKGYADLHLRGDIASGLEVGKKLVGRYPDDSHAHALLSMAHYYAGDYQQALEHIDRALAADPFNYGWEGRRRSILVSMGDYLGVKQAAFDCRVSCWTAALDWWESLSMHGNQFHYVRDIETLAGMYDDERAFDAGDATRKQSLIFHANYVFRDRPNPYMRDFKDLGSTGGLSHWVLMLMHYGLVDEAFSIAIRGVETAPAIAITNFLERSRLTPPEEIRADPRYHAIFEIPRFKAVAEYRESRGMSTGLPVLPIKRWDASD